ncbi:MAG: hypothetical protein EAY75_06700 [Bacteroidetes bacterium]|nr:MAG: hypothetical protein EAY75_06700 [Bacteroidota bacterium]
MIPAFFIPQYLHMQWAILVLLLFGLFGISFCAAIPLFCRRQYMGTLRLVLVRIWFSLKPTVKISGKEGTRI